MKTRTLLCLYLFCGTAAVVTANPEQPAPSPVPENPPPSKTDMKPTVDAKKSRGQLLYENHCTRCHESVVHIRTRRKAANLNDLYKWTTKWSEAEKLHWTGDETRDVVDYLNREYYQLKK